MKKYLPIYLYGTIIIFSGVFLLFSKDNTLNVIRFTLGITLVIGAVIAFGAAQSRQRKQVQFAYHEMHALIMVVYAVLILLFCNTFEKLFSFTSFLFIFYAFSEIIFCNWLFNLGQKVVFKIVIVRLVLGLVIGIGAVLSMNYTEFILEGFGVLFVIVGVNILLYVPVMQKHVTKSVSEEG